MSVTTRIEEVRKEVTTLAHAAPSAKDLMEGVCKLLHERMLKYNWVGFYMLEPGAQPPALVLEARVPARGALVCRLVEIVGSQAYGATAKDQPGAGVVDHGPVVERHRRQRVYRVPAGVGRQFGDGGGGHQPEKRRRDRPGVRHPVGLGEHRELLEVCHLAQIDFLGQLAPH